MARIDQTPGIRPRLTLGRRLDIAARHGFPAALTVFLMIAVEAPLKVPQQAAFLPAVALISVWFWSVYRPAAMSPPIVFVIGVVLDLRGYLPLGSGVLTLLITHGIAGLWRRVLLSHRFGLVWLAFVPIALGGSAMLWFFAQLLNFRLLSPGPAIFQAVVTTALYPVLAMPYLLAHRSVADPEQA